MEKLYFSLGLIAAGLCLGYTLQLIDRSGSLLLPVPLARLRLWIQKFTLLCVMPICFFAALWGISIDDARIILLPIVCVVALVAGGVFGLALAKLLKKSPAQTGALFCCGSFTNIGAVGGLVCYVFWGELGFALASLYKMFEEAIYYAVGFPVARYIGGQYGGDSAADGNSEKLVSRLGNVLRDPFISVVFLALLLGITFNFLNIPRSALWSDVTALLVPLGVFLLIFSIGMGMRFSRVGKYLKESCGLALIKFVATPLVVCATAVLLGLDKVGDGTAFKVALVLSAMPVAFNAMVASSIFRLDLDLANSCWLVTTCLLVIVIPVLSFLV